MTPSKFRVPWTYPEQAELRRLRLVERLTVRAIARKLGRTYAAIRTKLDTLGISEPSEKPRYAPGELKRLVVRLYRPGVSMRDVARILGVHVGSVQSIAHRCGKRGVNRVRCRMPCPDTIRRPFGYEWKPGEKTACIIRLMSLNQGLGIPTAEIADRLSLDPHITKTRVKQILKGVAS